MLKLGIILSIFSFYMSSFAKADQSVFGKVSGTWSYIGSESRCDSQFRVFSFFDNNKRMRIDYSGAFLSKAGTPVADSLYSVISYTPNSITVSLDTETQTTPNGDKVKWILLLIDSETFVWRQAHWTDDISNESEYVWPYRRIRCPLL